MTLLPEHCLRGHEHAQGRQTLVEDKGCFLRQQHHRQHSLANLPWRPVSRDYRRAKRTRASAPAHLFATRAPPADEAAKNPVILPQLQGERLPRRSARTQ